MSERDPSRFAPKSGERASSPGRVAPKTVFESTHMSRTSPKDIFVSGIGGAIPAIVGSVAQEIRNREMREDLVRRGAKPEDVKHVKEYRGRPAEDWRDQDRKPPGLTKKAREESKKRKATAIKSRNKENLDRINQKLKPMHRKLSEAAKKQIEKKKVEMKNNLKKKIKETIKKELFSKPEPKKSPVRRTPDRRTSRPPGRTKERPPVKGKTSPGKSRTQRH